MQHKDAKETVFMRGFTLIELLVVIAIIGLLSSIVLASLTTSRAKARDARRLSDLHQMQTALEMFATENGRYPTESAPDNANVGNTGKICSTCTGGINTILRAYMPAIPDDPINDATHYYYYDGLQTCGAGTAPVLAVIGLESYASNRTTLCNGTWGGEGSIGAANAFMIVFK